MLNVIDGNALGNAHHAATTLSIQGFQTQAIYGYVRMMREMTVSGGPGSRSLILWDGRSKKRYAMFPTYKADRELRLEDPEQLASKNAYRAQVPVIQKALTLLGFTQMVAPDYEADDLAGVIVRKFDQAPKRLITGDEDWLQLVNARTEWFDPRKDGKRINYNNFHLATGYFTQEEFLHGKCLIGDGSDNIPGIPDIGDKTAATFMAEHRSVYEFFKKVDAGAYVPKARKSKNAKSLHPEQVLASPEGRQIFDRNMQLMDLRDPNISQDEIVLIPAGFDPDKFKTLCERLGFVSLLRSYDDWIQPFKGKA